MFNGKFLKKLQPILNVNDILKQIVTYMIIMNADTSHLPLFNASPSPLKYRLCIRINIKYLSSSDFLQHV